MRAHIKLDAAVNSYRASRTKQIYAVISKLLGRPFEQRRILRPEIEFALLHHTVLDIKDAATSADLGRAMQTAIYWETSDEVPALVDSPVGKIAVAKYEDLLQLTNVGTEMPIWIFTPQVLDQYPAHTAGLIYETIEMIVAAGYQWVVERGLGALVLLKPRELGTANSSWSTTIQPCTINSDYCLPVTLWGAEVVHESIHNWLNDCLMARRVELSPEAKFYSPWKSTNRPAFGILHATLAFASVYNYLRFLIDQKMLVNEPSALQFAQAMAEQQRQHLIQVRDTIGDVLAEVHDHDIVAVFVEALERTAIYDDDVPGYALLSGSF